ncbi:hypothetical protein [Klenkia soli]|uniref:hypothetical protein n=1 Tax=Klenkia soli TaxID=1052260 RepID=UPI00104215FF|nr:hypothetical protein [Klenkia soli]
MVSEDLPVSPAWRKHSPADIADGHDGLGFPCSCGAGSPERHQFGAEAAGEVRQVDRNVDVTALVADGSTDGVHLAVTVLVDDLGGRSDQRVVAAVDLSGLAIYWQIVGARLRTEAASAPFAAGRGVDDVGLYVTLAG